MRVRSTSTASGYVQIITNGRPVDGAYSCCRCLHPRRPPRPIRSTKHIQYFDKIHTHARRSGSR